MKIKKLFISVFLTAFSIGVIGYWLIPKIENESQKKEIAKVPLKETILPKIETDNKPNVYEIEHLWRNEPIFRINLLEAGENFHGEDIKAKSGETWLGLFEDKDNYYLRSSKIKIENVYDDLFDYKKNRKTGINLSVKDKSKPLFLLKNADKIRAGKVKTLFRGLWWDEAYKFEKKTTELENGFIKKFKLGNEEYKLEVKEGVDKKGRRILVLELQNKEITQIVSFVYYYESFEPVGNLLWVGDLDHDGKLDLYMDFYGYEKGGYSSGLFLSSEAETGKLVKQVAGFTTTGC